MKENYSHETFTPGFDPHGSHTKIEREEDLPVAGVNLVGSKTFDTEEAGDETYALPADKGVVVQVIPGDQLPTDTDGNKAELDIPERRPSGIISLPYMAGDYDGITLIPRPRQLTSSKNHQRHGYSRRKAKHRASWNGLFKARFKERCSRIMGWMDSCSDITFDQTSRANITIVDLSDTMQMPTGPVAYVPVKGRNTEGITVVPRPLGISKLFEDVL